ncbi:helix-turn-helix domain-containing protein [Gordonia sp. DT218]|uniref:helix-turn-helix domain-containing protein n=1 Tax=unclassified Gordonia (in: high G+C Gram-positive bacteria) TaxID=2657482 RepID=UPI003CEAECD2
MAVLLREALGESLRRVRTTQGRTLREVSTDARVSLGYLSEVERGQKEASSELLAAICDALDVEIAELLLDIGLAMLPADSDRLIGAETIATTDMGVLDAKVVIPGPAGRSEEAALAAA